MNNGDGTFTADIDRVLYNTLYNPLPEVWRHWGHALADLNGDGRLDLIRGQSRDADPTHVNEFSMVLYNDGDGRFPPSHRLLLPRADFNAGFTIILDVGVLDIDGDGLKDLILPQTRDDYTGRYVQILMNRGAGRFVDETLVRMGDQSATTGRQSVVGGPLANQVDKVFITDVDNDGSADLVLNSQWAKLRNESPLVYLNNGRGQFVAMDANVLTDGDLYFGENSVPLDLDGNGVIDFVHTDIVADEVTQLIALVGAGAPCAIGAPTLARAQVSGSTVTLSWALAQTALGFVLEAGSGPGMSNIVVFDTGSAATTFIARDVPGGVYHVRVRARIACGTSSPSNEIVVTVP
jgi:hypothetical protein